MNKKINNIEFRQRFGFRKLASGMLVSGVIGAFFLIGGQSVQAATPENGSVDTAVVETNKQEQKNTETDTKQVAAQTEEAKVDNQVKTAANTDSKQKITSVENEIKDNSKTSENTDTSKEAKQATIIDSDKKSDTEKATNTQESQSQINFDDWDYTTNNDGVTINNYKRTDVADVVVPNTYDFVNAGIITDGKKAYIYSRALNAIARTNGVKSITISHNGDGKLYVADGNLNGAFNSNYSPATVEKIDVSNLDVSNVTSMTYTFSGLAHTTDIIGLDKWNVSKVTDLTALFYYSGKLSAATYNSLANWDTSNVTSFQTVFGSNDNLSDLKFLKNWKTSKAKSFYAMFASDYRITDVSPISHWDTSKAEKMTTMFIYDYGITNIDALNTWDVSNVTEMDNMFSRTGINGLVNLSNWSLNKKGVNTNAMFAGGTFYPNGHQVIINTPLMVIVKDQDSADMINNGEATFQDRYLTKFIVIVGQGETLNGNERHDARAFISVDAAKSYFGTLLKETTASKDGYTFKGWSGVDGTEYGNSGLFGEYKPVFESNTPVEPDTPVSPDTPTTGPVQPTNPDDNKGDKGDDNNVKPLPEKPTNHKPGKNNNSNVKNSGYVKVNGESATLVNTSVKAASAQNGANELPQTGSKNTNLLAALGLGIVSALGLFGLADRKKRN